MQIDLFINAWSLIYQNIKNVNLKMRKWKKQILNMIWAQESVPLWQQSNMLHATSAASSRKKHEILWKLLLQDKIDVACCMWRTILLKKLYHLLNQNSVVSRKCCWRSYLLHDKTWYCNDCKRLKRRIIRGHRNCLLTIIIPQVVMTSFEYYLVTVNHFMHTNLSEMTENS